MTTLRYPLRAALWLAIMLSAPGLPASADSSDEHLAKAVDKAKHATVGILEATPEGRESGYQTGLSFRGTGVHLRDGYILTARHAVERQETSATVVPEQILILTWKLEELPAKLVGGHPYLDLVLYKLPAMVDSLENADIPLSVLETVPGQPAFTVGYPLGWGPAVAFGRVGNPNTFLNTVDTRLIQSDVPVCSGNSGGGLFNHAGELIGVMHAIIKTDDAKGGYGCSRLAFAIPATLARKVFDALLEGKQPAFARLGIQIKAVKVGRRWRIAVGDLQDKAPGGIQKGDLLLAIEDTEIVTAAQLKTFLMERTTPGQKVTLRVLRGDRELPLAIVLGGS